MLSEQLVRLPEVVFALVIAQSLINYRDIIVTPFPPGDWSENAVALLALLTIGVTVVMSWYDWHVTMELRPYDMGCGWPELLRVIADMAVVVVYAYVLFTVDISVGDPVSSIWQFLLGYPIVYGLYLVSGRARQVTFGPMASNLRPILVFALILLAVLVIYLRLYERFTASSGLLNILTLTSVLLFVVSYRLERHRMVNRKVTRKRRGLRVGIDVDGVLGNQITGVLPRIEREYGIPLTYSDITEWHYSFGPSDITREILKAQKDRHYLLDMPVHPGARQMLAALYPNHPIDMTTARPAEIRDATESWLHRKRLYYDDLHTTEEAKKSGSGVDILVDDRAENLVEYLQNSNGHGILVRQPWNQDGEELLPWLEEGRASTVDTLSEIPAIVESVALRRRVSPLGQAADRCMEDVLR